MELRRLFPEPGAVTPEQAVSGMRLGDRAPEDRPYLVVNFVATADGKASVGGRSGPIGDDADREMFHRLRTQADAVFVGSGTLRAERYGRLVRDAELRAAREREGLAADPLAVTVTRSLDLPPDLPLLAAPEQRVVIFTSSDRELEASAASVTVERMDPAELTMTAVMRRLRADHGMRSVLCEGGPTVFGALLAECVADELFLTVSPKVAGGAEAPTIVAGPPLPEVVMLELQWLLEHENALFHRYRIVKS